MVAAEDGPADGHHHPRSSPVSHFSGTLVFRGNSGQPQSPKVSVEAGSSTQLGRERAVRRLGPSAGQNATVQGEADRYAARPLARWAAG